MTQRRLGTIDLDTGEICEDGIPVWVGKKPKLHERWFMAFQEAFESLATDRDLTLDHLRVLNFLFSRLDFDNFIQVPQSEIAAKLGMHKPNVSKAISELVEKRIIIRGPKVGRSSSFRLNPNYGWKGKVSNLREAQRKHLEIVK